MTTAFQMARTSLEPRITHEPLRIQRARFPGSPSIAVEHLRSSSSNRGGLWQGLESLRPFASDLSLWNQFQARKASATASAPSYRIQIGSRSTSLAGSGSTPWPSALAVKDDDPEVLAFIYRGKLSTTRRKKSSRRRFSPYRHCSGICRGRRQAVFNLYFEQFRPNNPGQ